MRSNRATGTITLSEVETRVWRRIHGPTARGCDLGRAWVWRASLVAMADALAASLEGRTVQVLLADGAVVHDTRPKPAPRVRPRAGVAL